MYKVERTGNPQDLKLNDFAKGNLDRLLNNPETKQIVISGEGEPFNNESVIADILNTLNDKKEIQVVTNGNWRNEIIDARLSRLNALASKSKNICNIRLSIDSFHLNKVKIDTYVKIFDSIINKDSYPHVSLSVRSLIEEKELARKTIADILKRLNCSSTFKAISGLEDLFILPNNKIEVVYKNLILPLAGYAGNPSLTEYLSNLKQKNNTFTFGFDSDAEGLRLTIKPNGDIFFYGIEIQRFGNIFQDKLEIPHFKEIAKSHPLIKEF